MPLASEAVPLTVIELLVVDELFAGAVIATAGGVVSGGAPTVTDKVPRQFPLPVE
jgi:hypothetical protein